MFKFGKNGKPGLRLVRLSRDQQLLQWTSKRKKPRDSCGTIPACVLFGATPQGVVTLLNSAVVAHCHRLVCFCAMQFRWRMCNACRQDATRRSSSASQTVSVSQNFPSALSTPRQLAQRSPLT